MDSDIRQIVESLIDVLWRKSHWAKEYEALTAEQNQELPSRYFALFHRWFLFGILGFGAVMAILWLMIAKPI